LQRFSLVKQGSLARRFGRHNIDTGSETFHQVAQKIKCPLDIVEILLGL
jgi:hypothetical protein